MRRMWMGVVMGLGLGLSLAGCVEADDAGPPGPGDDGYDWPMTEAACADAGGNWAHGGLRGGEMCFLTMPDAGKSCRKASDCAGECLAETNSCAEIAPMFGCFEIRTESGDRVMLCAD